MKFEIKREMRSLLAAVASVLVVAACGGGGGGAAVIPAGALPASGPTAAPPIATTDENVARFLTQATFGPTPADMASVQQLGFSPWLEDQFRQARSSHLDFVLAQVPLPVPSGTTVTMDPMYQSFWKQAVTGTDPVRQRVTYALSQILVTSAADANLSTSPHTMASYLDTLSTNAFGNYRDLLQAVALHPAMGQYLTTLGNRGDGGRTPDENFARESMQLFTIGLMQLNVDGTPKLVNGNPVDTYGAEDIRGLAKVFTGWGWGNVGTPDPVNGRFAGNAPADDMRRVIPMQFYSQYHANDATQFLGSSIPANTPGPTQLTMALDTLFNHPNVGPFVATRLIQHMVTSNPSPAYVGRVATAFNDNGKGVRGDMKSVIRAVLFDPEAQPAAITAQSGKLREPIARVTSWLRAFNAVSTSGTFRIPLSDASLFQTPLRAPSVFNFFRPGFVPPNSNVAAANLVAPEFQITHEVSVATYANFIQSGISAGIGTSNDVKADYTALLTIADDPDALIDRINLLLAYRSLAPANIATMRSAINAIPITATNARQNRTYLALYLTMISPEFLVQK